MNHPPIEGTHDHGITHAHPVNQSTARDNVLIQPHTSNEGRGKRRDIMATNKTSKQRSRDSEASPVRQQWDSPILIDNKHDPAPCRTHHGQGLDRDALLGRYFVLKVYLCGVLGDMLGSAKLSKMAGHMALHGCRFSTVQDAHSSTNKGVI